MYSPSHIITQIIYICNCCRWCVRSENTSFCRLVTNSVFCSLIWSTFGFFRHICCLEHIPFQFLFTHTFNLAITSSDVLVFISHSCQNAFKFASSPMGFNSKVTCSCSGLFLLDSFFSADEHTQPERLRQICKKKKLSKKVSASLLTKMSTMFLSPKHVHTDFNTMRQS